MNTALFIALAAAASLSAIWLVCAREFRHSLFAFLGVNVFVGSIFICNNAVFLGMALLLINGGAVFVLFMFATMMLGRRDMQSKPHSRLRIFVAVGIALLLAVLMLYVVNFNLVIKSSTDFDFEMVARFMYYDAPFPVLLLGFMLVVVGVGAGVLLHQESPVRTRRADKIELKPDIEIKRGAS